MRKNYFSIAKLFLMGAVVASGVTFTSCSDKMDDMTESKTEATSQMYNGNVFTYNSVQNGDLTVKINDNDAIVTRGTEAGTKVNAKLVYNDQFTGNLEVTDGTLSGKKIPFVKCGNILQLNFNGTGDFSDCTIYMKGEDVTTRDEYDDIYEAMNMGEKIAEVIKTTSAKSLFSSAVNGCMSTLGSKAVTLVWNQLFPTENPDIKYFNALNEKIDQIDNHVSSLAMYLTNEGLTKTFTTHQEYIQQLHNAVEQTLSMMDEANKMSGTEKEKATEDAYEYFANAVLNDGSKIRCSLIGMINNYTERIGGNSIFEQVDEFIITRYPFLSQSEYDRDIFRSYDAETFREAANLLYAYFTESAYKSPSSAKLLETAINNFGNYMKENGGYDHFDKYVVCTLGGAQFIMEKTAETQSFGLNTFTGSDRSCRITGVLNSVTWFEDRANSYLYSKKSMEKEARELKDSCLTTTEAQTIMSSCGTEKTLNQLLTDLGVKGLDDPKQIMLLGGNPQTTPKTYNNFRFRYDDVSMQAPVWDNATNKYNASYEVGYLKILNNGSNAIGLIGGNYCVRPAYYTKVVEHFGTKADGNTVGVDTSYNNFMKKVITHQPLPEEDENE